MYGETEHGERGSMWAVGFAATVVLHVGIIVGVILGARHDQKRPIDDRFVGGQVVNVEAVKFGKPRDLSFLPHKEAVVVDKGPKPQIKLTENDKALPHLKDPNEKPPAVDDPLKHTHAEAFKNLIDQTEQAGAESEGDPNGVKGGTASVGRGPVYYQHLKAAVQNAWSVPTTISDSDLAKLSAMACFKIDETGKITEVAIKKGSGNDRFDNTLLDALGAVKETWSEAPTSDVKEAVTTEGVCINFNPSR